MFYDKYGYFAQRPVTPDKWETVVPEMPPGRLITNHTIPPGMLVIENFLDPNWAERLLRECEAAKGVPHGIGAEGARVSVESDVRHSEHVDTRSLETDVNAVIRHIFKNIVAPHFKVEIEWYERPEILRYRDGGKYVPHADSENWIDTERRWKRVINRDLSILIYLNDEFEGGEISFSNFGFDLKPSSGLLVAFPSDHRYLHEAQLVKSGVRYAIVSWAATIGGPRVEAALTPNIVRM